MKKNYRITTPMSQVPDAEEESLLRFYDPANEDLTFFNMVDEETIRLGGSPVWYFKYLQSETNFDDVYMENRQKAISSDPILVNTHYEPKALEENLTEFGIELSNEQLFIFNHSYISRKLGRFPIPGDVIKPKFQNQRYEITEAQEEEFALYGVYHITCTAKLLRDTTETLEDPINQTDNLGEQL